jgi:hypothetical protein
MALLIFVLVLVLGSGFATTMRHRPVRFSAYRPRSTVRFDDEDANEADNNKDLTPHKFLATTESALDPRSHNSESRFFLVYRHDELIPRLRIGPSTGFPGW